jgi:hypothetical protein
MDLEFLKGALAGMDGVATFISPGDGNARGLMDDRGIFIAAAWTTAFVK